MTLLAALCLIGAQAAVAAQADFDARLDAAYTELGKGDLANATQHATDLLATTAPADARRARALQLRLDVCLALHEIAKPSCATLPSDIDAFTADAGSSAALRRGFEIDKALDAGDAGKAFAIAQAAVASTGAADMPELRLLLARAAVQAPGQMPASPSRCGNRVPARKRACAKRSFDTSSRAWRR